MGTHRRAARAIGAAVAATLVGGAVAAGSLQPVRPPSPAEVALARAATAMAAQPTVRIDISDDVSYTDDVPMQTRIQEDVDLVHGAIAFSGNTDRNESVARVLPPTAYVKTVTHDGVTHPWTKQALAQAVPADGLADAARSPVAALRILGAVRTARVVAPGHVAGRTDLGDYTSLFAPVTVPGLGAHVDVYLGADGLPQRITETGAVGRADPGASIAVTLTYTYGIAVSVQAPPAAQVQHTP